jgi:hypothetical protein
MSLLFRDLCRDAYRRSGVRGLAHLWIRTAIDLLWSVIAAHAENLKERLMPNPIPATPMPWRQVALVAGPGLLFALSRSVPGFWWPSVAAYLLVIALAAITLLRTRRLPTWSLLALGLLASWILQWAGAMAMDQLARMRVQFSVRQLIVGIPFAIAVVALAWASRKRWPVPSWLVVLCPSVILAASAAVGRGLLGTLAVLSLPLAAALVLSGTHGARASLLVVGAYAVYLFDSDHISGPLLNGMGFYPAYAIGVSLLWLGVAPLLSLRARSWLGQTLGLLIPIALAMTAAVVIPWSIRPEAHSLRIWLGGALASVFVLTLIAAAMVVQGQRLNNGVGVATRQPR